MDYNLLRSWLGLPPGSWPPDHYTVLGFPPGKADPAAVEPRVMDRMDLLRRHQLVHPDLVTEGMNQLAQALITLTDPAGKAGYDSELGFSAASPPPPPPAPIPRPAPKPQPQPAPPVRPIPFVVAEPIFDDDVFADDASQTDGETAGEVTQEIVGQGGGGVVYDLVEAETVAPLSLGPDLIPEAAPDEPVEGEVVEGGIVEPLELPGGFVDPSARRWVYARLALIRRGLRSWAQFHPTLTDPEEPLDRPGRVLLLLEAVYDVRPLLPALRGLVGGVEEPGGMVAAVVNNPLVLDTFRRLLPDQRRALAVDWQLGHAELQKEYGRLRGVAKTNRPRPIGGRRPHLLRWIEKMPEIMLAALALLAFLIALLRGTHHP